MNIALLPLDADNLDAVLPMVAAYHDFEGVDSSAAERESAVLKLLAQPHPTTSG